MSIKSLLATAALTSLLSLTAWADSTVSFDVQGMTCGACVKAVEGAFKEAGYDGVVVSLDDKKATLSLKGEQKIEDAKITKIVESAGFKTSKVERK